MKINNLIYFFLFYLKKRNQNYLPKVFAKIAREKIIENFVVNAAISISLSSSGVNKFRAFNKQLLMICMKKFAHLYSKFFIR